MLISVARKWIQRSNSYDCSEEENDNKSEDGRAHGMSIRHSLHEISQLVNYHTPSPLSRLFTVCSCPAVARWRQTRGLPRSLTARRWPWIVPVLLRKQGRAGRLAPIDGPASGAAICP